MSWDALRRTEKEHVAGNRHGLVGLCSQNPMSLCMIFILRETVFIEAKQILVKVTDPKFITDEFVQSGFI